jgi:biopolymer transport protein ExbD
MIPMIDLLMVTISFLLITAVWVHSQRLAADAQVPGSATTPPCDGACKQEPTLHVETADPAKFVLAWKQGATVLRSTEVVREAAAPRPGFPALAAQVDREWHASGVHREPSDHVVDRAVVHAANEMRYSELVAVMDAVGQPTREHQSGGKVARIPAFGVTLANE